MTIETALSELEAMKKENELLQNMITKFMRVVASLAPMAVEAQKIIAEMDREGQIDTEEIGASNGKNQ